MLSFQDIWGHSGFGNLQIWNLGLEHSWEIGSSLFCPDKSESLTGSLYTLLKYSVSTEKRSELEVKKS